VLPDMTASEAEKERSRPARPSDQWNDLGETLIAFSCVLEAQQFIRASIADQPTDKLV
jgi:hypothetical protein